MNRKILLCILIVILTVSCFPSSAFAVNPPHLQSADAVLVVDMNTDTIMYELNKENYHSIASLTKIMTCLLAVEAVEQGRANLTDMVTAQADCLQGLDVSSSNAGIQPGEILTYEDLLYCALVHSANDACNVLGTYIDGSIGAFVNHMNQRADQIGCRNTNFVDTCGMLNRTEGHYSCPADLYLITKEALTHPLFANVCGTADYTVHATNYRPSFEIHNSNALMSKDGLYGSGYLYDGVIGVKTGFTKPAGYCLISVCQRREGKIMAIVLGCNGPLTYTFAGEYQNFQDSITIYDWAFSNFTNKTMFLAGEPMQRVAVEKAKEGGTVALCASDNLVLLLPNDVTDKEITTEIIPDDGALVAPIRQGQALGTINVYVRGEKYSSVRLIADADVEIDEKIVRNEKIHDFFTSKALKTVLIILCVLLVALIALRFYLRIRRRQDVRQRIARREGERAETRSQARMNAAGRTIPVTTAKRDPVGEESHSPQIRRIPREDAPRKANTDAQQSLDPKRVRRTVQQARQTQAGSASSRQPQPRQNAPGQGSGTKIQVIRRPASEAGRQEPATPGSRSPVIHDMSRSRAAVREDHPVARRYDTSPGAPPTEEEMQAILDAFREEKKNSGE